MKRIVVLALLLGLVSLVVCGCGGEPTPTLEPTDLPPTATSPAVTQELKVCFIHNSFVGDMGWSYAHDRGRQYLEENVDGVTTAYVENVPDASPDVPKIVTDFANQGCQLIIGTSFGYADGLKEAAVKHPELTFQNFDYTHLAPNVGLHRVRTDQGMYLAGLVAGKITESNTIGVVGTFPIPQIVRQINAFALGAQAANPEATVKVVWLNSWYDPPKETEAAAGLIAVGADVVAHQTSSPSIIQEAEKQGAFSIGFQNDQGEFGPEYHLTDVTYEWGPLYAILAEAVIDGTWQSEDRWFGLAEGAIGLSPLGPAVPEDVHQLVEEKHQQIISGELQVFQGPVKDQEGNVRVPEGQALSLDDLLTVDWFVEGVEGTIAE